MRITRHLRSISPAILLILGVPCVSNAFAGPSLVPALDSNNFYPYGAAKTAEARVTAEPFRTAMTITNLAPGHDPWDSGASTPTLTGNIAKGDRLQVSLYARALSPAVAKIEVSVELAGAPYTSSGRRTMMLKKSWQRFTVPAVAMASYNGSQIHIIFHTAFAKETVQVGGVKLIDTGK